MIIVLRCFSWVKTDTGDARLADCLEENGRKLIDPDDIGIPSFFISHAWKGTVQKLINTTANALRNASDNTCVWIDFIAVNQHSEKCREINKEDVASFERTLERCEGTIVAVDMAKCNPATRGWCLYEWDKTIEKHGYDGLSFAGMSLEDRVKVVKGIDVENAECFSPDDWEMILGNIRKNYTTTAAFNTYLKLQLMLCPLSYKTDLEQLSKRSKRTKWDFGPVREWLKGDTRCLCFKAGAGMGKSTLSAALLKELFPRITSPTHVIQSPATLAAFKEVSKGGLGLPIFVPEVNAANTEGLS